MPKTKSKKKAKKKKPRYSLVIQLNDEEFVLKGENVSDMIEEFHNPSLIKTRLVASLKEGTKHSEATLFTNKARRVFGNSTSRQLFADTLVNRLK